MDLGPSSRRGGLLARVMLLAAVAATAGCASANDNETRMLDRMRHDIDQNTSDWGNNTLGADGLGATGLGPSAPAPPSASPPVSTLSPPSAPPPPLAPLVPPTEPPPGQIATPPLPVVHVVPADEAPLRLTNADLVKSPANATVKSGDAKGEETRDGKPKARKSSGSDGGPSDR